jgi:DNA mismatch repair protein MutS2
MNYKTLITLDFDKIRTIISSFTQYSVAAEKALKIVPITNIDEIHKRQTYIQESLDALEKLGISIGGARDIRHSIKAALHADILTPQELLDIRSTIEAACDIKRLFEKYKGFFPHLYELTSNIELPQNLLNNIIKSISERGEITDQASPCLEKSEMKSK